MNQYLQAVSWNDWRIFLLLGVALLLVPWIRDALLFLVQWLDERWVDGLQWLTKITGAAWMPLDLGRQFLKWALFFVIFGTVFKLGALGEGVAAPVRMLIMAVGYVLALSVGRTWIREETKVLNGEASSTHISDQMRPMAMWSYVFLFVLIPFTFDAANRMQWFKGSDAYQLGEWFNASVDLLLRVVVDFLELINPQVQSFNMEYQSWPAAALVLGHFCTLAYVVMNGLGLVARSDQSQKSDLERIKREGSLGQLVRQGKRVVRKLVRILEAREKNVTPKGQAAAAKLLGLIAEKHNGHLTERAVVALLAATENKDRFIRENSVEALGRLRDREERPKIRLLELLKNDQRKSTVKKAGGALRNLAQARFTKFDATVLRQLVAVGLFGVSAPKGELEHSRRSAITYLFKFVPTLATENEVREKLKKWHGEEQDKKIRRNLETALSECEAEALNRTLRLNFQRIRDLDPSVREKAAEELGCYLSDNRVPPVLLSQLNVEKEVRVRFAIVLALYQNPTASRLWSRRIMTRLRQAMADPVPNVRAAACLGLGCYRPALRTTVPLLQRKVNEDGYLQVEQSSVIALAYLGDLRTIKDYVAQEVGSSNPKGPSDPELQREIKRILRELDSEGSKRGDDNDPADLDEDGVRPSICEIVPSS